MSIARWRQKRTRQCRFPTRKCRSPDGGKRGQGNAVSLPQNNRSPDGGKRGQGNAVSLPQNVDRPMEAKEDTAPCRFPTRKCRSPDRAHHHHPIFRETALPCPNFFALRQNNRSPDRAHHHHPIFRKTVLPCPNFR